MIQPYTACPTGSYGINCLNDCTKNCNESSCDHINGSCQFGCQDGYSGDMCTKEGRASIHNHSFRTNIFNK